MTLEEEKGELIDFLELHVYLTGPLSLDKIHNLMMSNSDFQDPITKLETKTRFGRCNFSELFEYIGYKHEATTVGVFYCGPKSLAGVIKDACKQHTSVEINGTIFKYFSENF